MRAGISLLYSLRKTQDCLRQYSYWEAFRLIESHGAILFCSLSDAEDGKEPWVCSDYQPEAMPWVPSARLGRERESVQMKAQESPSLSRPIDNPAETKTNDEQRPKARPAPPGPFQFGYRRHPIDWRVLHGVDIERLVCLSLTCLCNSYWMLLISRSAIELFGLRVASDFVLMAIMDRGVPAYLDQTIVVFRLLHPLVSGRLFFGTMI